MTRPIFLSVGWLCVGLGVLGVVIPLFPTTPFLLVAVWAFSRSSPEMAEKLRSNRYVGPYIRDWQDNGVIPLQAKVAAIAMMASVVAYLEWGTVAPQWVVAMVAVVLIAVGVFIVTRPSIPPDRPA
jgi:uncharacterized protein